MSLRPSWQDLPSHSEVAKQSSPRESPDSTVLPVNTLITGNASSRRAALAAVLGRTPPRVHVRSATKDLRVADIDEGVLIIHDIGALSSEGQESLFRWMEGVGSHVRVIALAERPIYELVEQQRFRADLYYRLCVVQTPI